MRLAYSFLLLIALVILSACISQSQPKETNQLEAENLFHVKNNNTKKLKFKKGIRAILEDSEGNIWFGGHQEGVCKYDGNEFVYYTDADGLSNNQVRSIFEDANGAIWFECGFGISKYADGKIITYPQMNFNFYTPWASAENDIWFKGNEGVGYNKTESVPGVYRWDGKNMTYHAFPLKPTPDQSNQYSVSTPFVKGNNNQYWFGTYSAVFCFDGSAVTIIDDKSLGLNDLSGYLHVRSLFEDSKGRLWIGNNGIGVLLKESDKISFFSEEMNLISTTSGRSGSYRSVSGTMEHVFAIGEDESGNIWFGDRDTGAWKYDGKGMKNYGIKDGLPSTHIWQIYKTNEGKLWFAMDNGSVLEFRDGYFVQVF